MNEFMDYLAQQHNFIAGLTKTEQIVPPDFEIQKEASATAGSGDVGTKVTLKKLAMRILAWSVLFLSPVGIFFSFVRTRSRSSIEPKRNDTVSGINRGRGMQHESTSERHLLPEENGVPMTEKDSDFALFSSLTRGGMADDPGARRRALTDYEAVRSSCQWRETGSQHSSSTVGSFDYMWWPTDKVLKGDYWGDLTSWMMTGGAEVGDGPVVRLMNWLFRPPPHGPTIRSLLCIADIETGEKWRIRRLGPLVGTGGFDWHRMKILDPFALRGEFAGGSEHLEGGDDNYFVTAHFLGPVSRDGDLLGNPPIHIHHANLNPEHKSANFSRLGQWHGDSQCLELQGGTSCYLRLLPRGYGFPIASGVPLNLDADLNDVRPAGSPELEFYLESAVRVKYNDMDSSSLSATAFAGIAGMGVLILGTPARFQWWHSTDFAGTYYVPTTKPSALWCTARLPVSGTFISGHIYTHQAIFQEALVFSGVSPQDLGLNLPNGPFQMKKPWVPWVPEFSSRSWRDGVEAMTALRKHVMTRLEGLERSCSGQHADSDLCTTPPRLVYNLNETSIDPEGGEARQMPWPSIPWTFSAGDQYTVVIFHKPLSSASSSQKHNTLMQQHLAIHGTYVPAPGDRAEYHYVLPTLVPERAWLDTPNSFLLLTRFGGPPMFRLKTQVVFVVLFVGLLVAELLFIGKFLSRRLTMPHESIKSTDDYAPVRSSEP